MYRRPNDSQEVGGATMTLAELFPARTDGNGVTWFRPARAAGADVSQWGWTSDPAQAHPDYDALNMCTCPHVDGERNPHCPSHRVDVSAAERARLEAAIAQHDAEQGILPRPALVPHGGPQRLT